MYVSGQAWHPTLSPLYDLLDHTNQLFSESLWHSLSTYLLNVANVWFLTAKIFKGRIKKWWWWEWECLKVGQWMEKTHRKNPCWQRIQHMWDLPQLPLHFSANLQRNKTYLLTQSVSIKNCVWPKLWRSGIRNPGQWWPLHCSDQEEVCGQWPHIKRLKEIEEQMLQRNLPQCFKGYINSLLTI